MLPFLFSNWNFSDNFSVFFLEHPTIKLSTKRIKLTWLYKLSSLISNFALTLGYDLAQVNVWTDIFKRKVHFIALSYLLNLITGLQGCQLSRIIRETADFELFLLVS